MTPYYDKDGITIYHGDCREVLPMLGGRSVDLVLTDPPYNISKPNIDARTLRRPGKNAGTFDYGEWDKDFDPLPLCAEFSRLLSSRGQAYVFTSSTLVSEWIDGLRAAFDWKILVWLKPDPLPQVRQRHWVNAAEFVLWCWRGQYVFNWLGHSEMFLWQMQQAPKQQAERVHPNQKPLSLIRKYVRVSTQQGDLILDPFVGSGTTLRAAKDAGCRAIGIESEERYCEIAAKRMSQEVFAFKE